MSKYYDIECKFCTNKCSEIQTKKNTNRSSCVVRGGHTFHIIRRSNPMALEAYVDTP